MRGAFLILVILASGCARKDAADDKDPQLPNAAPRTSLQPKSGGEMTLIPAGTFTMGDPKGQEDETPHTVAVAAFFMDRYPVTQEIYEKVTAVNPARALKNQAALKNPIAPRNPVAPTQWIDAVRFCNQCSQMEGLTPCYNLETWQCNFAADGYRLPTEAEWEYACRAGSTGKFCCGDDPRKLAEYAWFKPHSQGKLHEVGLKKPNAWGLHDMHGNVLQWCNDWYGEKYYASSPRENPTGPAEGKERVLRGGDCNKPEDRCRASYRYQSTPSFGDACFGTDFFGFRRVRADIKDKSNLDLRPKS